MITREIQFEKPEDDEFGDEDEDDGIVIEASNEKGKLYSRRRLTTSYFLLVFFKNRHFDHSPNVDAFCSKSAIEQQAHILRHCGFVFAILL